ncbi:MAG: peptidylprolyl isomerase [Mycobacteriales bacterium]
MASSKREKELARQRAERQAARRAAAVQRKKQRQAVIASVVAVLLIAGAAVATALTLGAGQDSPADRATESAPAGATAAASADPTPTAGAADCVYTKNETPVPGTKEVALPPSDGIERKQVFEVTMTTNRGDIVFEMDSSKTPCTANNLRSLAHFAFFDDTPCHRLTTEGISVLQCGSPDGSPSGGPGYRFDDENLEGATYERGTVAMANAGAGTNGSQFFLVYEDSTLPANFTPFGTITSGLDVLEKVAAAGSDESNGVGDGKPNLAVTIETLRARPKAD